MSIRNAKIYVRNICNGLVKFDPKNEYRYKMRTKLLLQQFDVLSEWIKDIISKVEKRKRILISHDQGIRYYCGEFGFRHLLPLEPYITARNSPKKVHPMEEPVLLSAQGAGQNCLG